MKKAIECAKKWLDKFDVASGYEKGDPNPVAIPVDLIHPETEVERFERFLRSKELAEAARREGFETEAEANDFDVDEDFEPYSKHETMDEDYFAHYEEDFSETPLQPAEAASEKSGGATIDDGAKEEDSTTT